MSDLDSPDFSSRYLGSPFDSASSLFPFNTYTRHEAHSIPVRQSPTAHRLPVEIVSEVFLYTVQADPRSRVNLMRVCRRWYDILLSTPGIRSRLNIGRWSRKRNIERFGRRWLLDVTFDTGGVHGNSEVHECLMVAAETASRWRSLALISLPPPGQIEDLQIMHPLLRLESFKLAASCNFSSYLVPLLSAITTTVTPRFTVMEIFHPDAALYLLQCAHFQNFSSLTTLRLICKRIPNPVDILPSLHKLEIFEAHHLFLPIYPLGVDLPPTQTLRVLHLKSVSVQWMAGQIFPVLAECFIIFPHYADAIQSVDMPSCSVLKYDSNNLSALEHFHISTLGKLEINCGQWRTWSGNLQLIRLHPIFAAQSLTCLHLEIKCSERLLAYMLKLVPALEELWMRLSNPHALSTAFFLALAAGGCNANADPPSQMIAPIGRKLRKLHLHYKRWLRGPERKTLIQAFGAVVASHPPEDSFRFHLSLDEGVKLQEWYIREPVEGFDIGFEFEATVIGVSSPYGIVPLSRFLVGDGHSSTESEYLPLPRESEYITTEVALKLPIGFLFSFHTLKEVKMTGLRLEIEPDTKILLNAPLFHTIKVLIVFSISSSFFAGQTFHKLERFKEEMSPKEPIPGQGPLTEMPVCTRLVVPLFRLATLKLPRIRELCLLIVAEHHHIWMKHIALNANLSGLKLLHLRYSYAGPSIAVIKNLGLLPALKVLIVSHGSPNYPNVDFFNTFVPMNVLGPSGLYQSSWAGQISGVLYPSLENLQIEGIRLTEYAELMPVLNDVVSLRATIGSPLKSFTFYFEPHSGAPQMWQLIGRDKSFIMEVVVPAEQFRFDI